MSSPFTTEIILDGNISSDQAQLKWNKAVEDCARKDKIKGKALFLHSFKDNNDENRKCVLHYYQNYGGDFCDTMFTGEIYEYGNGGCQVTGKITIPPGMKRFSWGLIAASIPLAFMFNLILYFFSPNLADNMPWLETFTFGGAVLAIIAIAIMCRFIDKRKVTIITDYLYEFLQNDQKGEIQDND